MVRQPKLMIKGGQLVSRKSKSSTQAKGYERYKNIAQGIGVRKDELLNIYEYETAVAGERARNLPSRPKDIAFKQKFAATKKQTRAYWKAYLRTTSSKDYTYKEFIRAGIHQDLPDVISERYAELKEHYAAELQKGSMTTLQLSKMISSEFFGS